MRARLFSCTGASGAVLVMVEEEVEAIVCASADARDPLDLPRDGDRMLREGRVRLVEDGDDSRVDEADDEKDDAEEDEDKERGAEAIATGLNDPASSSYSRNAPVPFCESIAQALSTMSTRTSLTML